MSKAKAKSETKAVPEHVNLAALLSTKSSFTRATVWIVGDTPLIVHAWSHKAKMEMLQKQVGAIRGRGKEARDPQQDFVDSLYDLGDGTYGFPVTGLKNAILSSAHKDKGIPKETVLRSLWLDADMHRVQPALKGAMCDLPLARIYGGNPEMREDMVKIGSGLNKVANLAYRGQFTFWGMKLSMKFNTAVITPEKLAFLIQEAGMGSGIGEWRNERKGMFGAFHLANSEEQDAWEAFAAKTGPLPVRDDYRQAAE